MSTLKKSLQTLGAIAAVTGMVAATPVPAAAGSNPCAPKHKSAKRAANPCKANPCAPKANPCAAKNPCAMKK